jgi:hypothetical protein
MRKNLTFLLSIPILFSACTTYDTIPSSVEGYAPVYSQDVSTLKTIKRNHPNNCKWRKNIYSGNLLFQVELDSGIHIINYTNPSSPVKLGFVKSFLCKEITVKNGFIYTNNLSDLVVIDINNPADIKEAGRTPNVFPDLASQYPPKNSNNHEGLF